MMKSLLLLFVLVLVPSVPAYGLSGGSFGHTGTADAIDQVSFGRTDEGRLYSDALHIAEFDQTSNSWMVGPAIPSIELVEGSYVWFPVQDYTPIFGKLTGTGSMMQVLRIDNYNVTLDAPQCCVGVSVTVSSSHVECQGTLCCGGNCCC